VAPVPHNSSEKVIAGIIGWYGRGLTVISNWRLANSNWQHGLDRHSSSFHKNKKRKSSRALRRRNYALASNTLEQSRCGNQSESAPSAFTAGAFFCLQFIINAFCPTHFNNGT
jgi:hypothetical protein